MNHLVVFDIETTGLDKKKDYIIQFSAIKYDRETNKIIATYDKYIQPAGNYTMSVAAISKHRITPEFLKDKPLFVEVANEIYQFMDGCDILTYNGIRFDAPFLKREFADCGIEWNFSDLNFYDAMAEEVRRNGNSLGDSFKRYTGKTMEEAGLDAHNALSDIKATLAVFIKQQKQKEYGPEEILTEDGFIRRLEFAGKDTECFVIGKWAGVSLEYVAKYDKSYLNWIISSNDFDKKTKMICESYIH